LRRVAAAAACILSKCDCSAEGEAEAQRHDYKLLHLLVISFESTMFSSLEVSYPTQHEGELKSELKSLNNKQVRICEVYRLVSALTPPLAVASDDGSPPTGAESPYPKKGTNPHTAFLAQHPAAQYNRPTGPAAGRCRREAGALQSPARNGFPPGIRPVC